MTNLEAWNTYTQFVTSPQCFLDTVYPFIWCSALERRVHYYPLSHMPLFCNLYVILVGPPGIGKNLTLNCVNGILRYHRDVSRQPIRLASGQSEFPYLFAGGPDATTFEGLLVELSGAAKTYLLGDTKVKVPYHSMCFLLDELSSLFRANRDTVTEFLLKAYDCGNYDYKPKHGGHDCIRNMSMSFCAGTTPSFLVKAKDSNIFNDGFSSRTLFVFGQTERQFRLHRSTMTEEQIKAVAQLRAHALALSKLSGELHYDSEVYDWLEEWNRTELAASKASASERMSHYFSRKNVHLLKLAAGYHFSENTDLKIGLPDIMRAKEMLERNEPAMTLGLSETGGNELLRYINALTALLKVKDMSLTDIVKTFQADLTLDQIMACIALIRLSHNVTTENTPNGGTIYRKIK